MMVHGVNSWIRSAGNMRETNGFSRQTRDRRGVLRAGIAGALLTLTLFGGVVHPAETSAKKSDSFTCTTLESMFTATAKAYEVARSNGMTEKAEQYLNTTFWLEGIYLDLDCSVGVYEPPDTAV